MLLRSTAIVIDSDSEDGIETDDDDDDSGGDQDILGLLSQMADDSGLRMATTTTTATATKTATVGRTQSTSVLETCRARTDIVERGLSKGRALGESRTFAGSILSQASPVACVCVCVENGRAADFFVLLVYQYSTLDVLRLIR